MGHDMPEPTNGALAKIINLDVLVGFVCTAVVTAVVVGMAWGSQENQISSLKDAQVEQVRSQKALEANIGKITTDVEVIKTKLEANQQQYLQQLERAKRAREASDRKLDAILQRLNESNGR